MFNPWDQNGWPSAETKARQIVLPTQERLLAILSVFYLWSKVRTATYSKGADPSGIQIPPQVLRRQAPCTLPSRQGTPLAHTQALGCGELHWYGVQVSDPDTRLYPVDYMQGEGHAGPDTNFSPRGGGPNWCRFFVFANNAHSSTEEQRALHATFQAGNSTGVFGVRRPGITSAWKVMGKQTLHPQHQEKIGEGNKFHHWGQWPNQWRGLPQNENSKAQRHYNCMQFALHLPGRELHWYFHGAGVRR